MATITTVTHHHHQRQHLHRRHFHHTLTTSPLSLTTLIATTTTTISTLPLPPSSPPSAAAELTGGTPARPLRWTELSEARSSRRLLQQQNQKGHPARETRRTSEGDGGGKESKGYLRGIPTFVPQSPSHLHIAWGRFFGLWVDFLVLLSKRSLSPVNVKSRMKHHAPPLAPPPPPPRPPPPAPAPPRVASSSCRPPPRAAALPVEMASCPATPESKERITHAGTIDKQVGAVEDQ